MAFNQTGRFLQLSALQSLPISCQNRDEYGNQKTAIIGGTLRGIISAQCSKKAMMDYCKSAHSDIFTGIRTRENEDILAEALVKLGTSEEVAASTARAFSVAIGCISSSKKAAEEPKDDDAEQKKDGGKKKKSSKPKDDTKDKKPGITFFCQKELEEMATILFENLSTLNDGEEINYEKVVSAMIDKYPNDNRYIAENALNIIMQGRMIAGSNGKTNKLRVDAAMAAMHSYTTHEVKEQFDYFTAVDERSSEPGAGMIGNTSFTSGTFFRYACIDLSLLDSVPENIRKIAVGACIEAFVKAISGARQTNMCSLTMPSYVQAIYTEGDRPWQSSAFIKGIPNTERGYEEESIARFKEDFESYQKLYFTGKTIKAYEMNNKLPLETFVKEIVKNV